MLKRVGADNGGVPTVMTLEEGYRAEEKVKTRAGQGSETIMTIARTRVASLHRRNADRSRKRRDS